jgi:hypothetical protein
VYPRPTAMPAVPLPLSTYIRSPQAPPLPAPLPSLPLVCITATPKELPELRPSPSISFSGASSSSLSSQVNSSCSPLHFGSFLVLFRAWELCSAIAGEHSGELAPSAAASHLSPASCHRPPAACHSITDQRPRSIITSSKPKSYRST